MNKTKHLFGSLFLLAGIFVFSNYVIVAQAQPDMTVDFSTKEHVIKNLLENLNHDYVFPKVAKKIEASVRSEEKQAEYAKITSARKFAQQLTKDVYAISKDGHLRVRYSSQKLPIRKAMGRRTKTEIETHSRRMKEVNFGFERVERLNGNIGYIELRGFMSPQQGEKTLASAMNFVANTHALIFDLRRNGGGSPAMVAMISSYLFGDEKVHLNDLYWRRGNRTKEWWTNPKVLGKKYLDKEVYILTSKRTFSAAEEFSYNLKNLKRATIVGETTGGGAHPGTSFRLHDHFSAFISTGRAISPITKTNWEGTGVKPHIAVSKEKALKTAHAIALKNYIDKETDPRRKASMRRLINTLEKEIGQISKEVPK